VTVDGAVVWDKRRRNDDEFPEDTDILRVLAAK
jgi:hypothetical protein